MAGIAHKADAVTSRAWQVSPFRPMHEGSDLAEIAADADLMQPLAMSTACVADARWSHERSISFRHGWSVAGGSLIP